MKKMNNILRFTVILTLFVGQIEAQTVSAGCVNGFNGLTQRPCGGTVQTAVPFLTIVGDARSGGLGDAGIALSPDANAMHFNASKYALADQKFGASLSYTPWLRNLGVNDIFLGYGTGFVQFGTKVKQAVGFGIRYFSLGSIQWTDINGSSLGEGTPREIEIAASYSRQLSSNFAVGGTLKYIYSNLATGQSADQGSEPIQSGTAIAADLSFTYRKPMKTASGKSNLTIGGAIKNIGSKVTYLRASDYLPTNLGIGAAYELPLDPFNSLTFLLDFNKLLVPTPQPLSGNQDWRNYSAISGIFKSFGDAPGGFSEELSEINTSLGVEYWYDKQFAVRAGYFYEPTAKGGRQYFTVGLGLKYTTASINLSYLVPASSQRGPLDNTLRFSLLFDAASFKDETSSENN